MELKETLIKRVFAHNEEKKFLLYKIESQDPIYKLIEAGAYTDSGEYMLYFQNEKEALLEMVKSMKLYEEEYIKHTK